MERVTADFHRAAQADVGWRLSFAESPGGPGTPMRRRGLFNQFAQRWRPSLGDRSPPLLAPSLSIGVRRGEVPRSRGVQ
jgi:hypothetical protein